MRSALPNASFIGFTGTPLMAGEEQTKAEFGDYVSVYNFKQAVDDDATVALYYENRIPELQLDNEQFSEELQDIVDEAELDEAQEKKLEREFAREYHLITREERLDKVAEDMVAHYMGRGFLGKAMVVSIDKVTALRMYNKVQRYWQLYIEELQEALAAATSDGAREELQNKIEYMEETDMALVVSSGQNEIKEFQAKGLDIKPHRKRMNDEDLDELFKDDNSRFRIVFVCAMWMTGFDVPSCSTIYLDKPMRNHTLMQTIARANRVFPEKNSGLIVDYMGVFRNLQKALAIYGASSGSGVEEGDKPIQDKQELVEDLKVALANAEEFCRDKGVDLDGIQAATGFAKIDLLEDGVEAILVSEDSKKEFLSLVQIVDKLFKAILPDPSATDYGPERKALVVLAAQIRSLTPSADISDVMKKIDTLLDQSVAAEPYVIYGFNDPESLIDLSKVDFEALQAYFAQGHKRTKAEKVKGAVKQKLHQMIQANKARVDLAQRFQELIEEYNAGSHNIDVFFQQLIAFMQRLQEEEQRSIQEGLTEEELAVFDLLTRPEISLKKKERELVKSVAQQLLETLKRNKLVLDWRKRQQSRAAVRLTIEDVLDLLPDVYSTEIYEEKCEQIYQHVYEFYSGAAEQQAIS